MHRTRTRDTLAKHMNALIGLPIYNEQQYLSTVLDRIAAYGHDMVAVDDGSTDGSLAMLTAREDVAVLTHTENQGYGQSLIDLFRYAIEKSYHWLVTIDCDLQHDTAEIPAFLAAAAENAADIISGTRYAKPAPQDAAPEDRMRINRLITETLNIALDLNLTDAFCGFKAYRVAALQRLDLNIPGYAMPLQLWVQAVRRGFAIRELPVRLIYTDAYRHFGGQLDDLSQRLRHYMTVLLEEMQREDERKCCRKSAAEAGKP